MSNVTVRDQMPTSLVGAAVAFAALTLAYSVLVLQSLLQWVLIMGTIVAIGSSVFVVYLLYRLVLVVEEIAERR